eukprot:4128529-Amphidinium_carterae.1
MEVPCQPHTTNTITLRDLCRAMNHKPGSAKTRSKDTIADVAIAVWTIREQKSTEERRISQKNKT